jgi:hypothetical protein
MTYDLLIGGLSALGAVYALQLTGRALTRADQWARPWRHTPKPPEAAAPPPARGSSPPAAAPPPGTRHRTHGLLKIIKIYGCGCVHTHDGTGRLLEARPCHKPREHDWDGWLRRITS